MLSLFLGILSTSVYPLYCTVLFFIDLMTWLPQFLFGSSTRFTRVCASQPQGAVTPNHHITSVARRNNAALHGALNSGEALKNVAGP